MQSFLTLTKLKRRLGLESAVLSAQDEARLLMALRAAEAQVMTHTGRRVAPLRGAVRVMSQPYDGETLTLPADLLALESLTIEGVTVNVAGIEVVGGTLLRQTNGDSFVVGEAVIVGLWAYHHAPDLAWRPSGAVLTLPITISDTTLTVADTEGADTAGEAPRLMTGHVVRMGSELLRVTATTSNTVTVKRAVNGTTVVSQSSGAALETFTPDAAAESLGYRWAAWLYREADGNPARAVPDA